MPRVIHFEIHAENPQRAITFYTGLFNWRFDKWPGPMVYWLITTGPETQRGINGGLILRRGSIDGTAVIAYVCTVDVAKLADAIGTVTKLGGTIVVPTMAIPGVGWLAYAKDTEGNIFGLMQSDPSAA